MVLKNKQKMERVAGIEPAYSAWKAATAPTKTMGRYIGPARQWLSPPAQMQAFQSGVA